MFPVLWCCVVMAKAQNRLTITEITEPYNVFQVGQVFTVNEDSVETYLPGATLQLFSLPDTTFVYGTVTDLSGTYVLNWQGKCPKLLFRVSYIGMETIEKTIRASVTIGRSGIEKFVLKPKSLTMEEVQVVAELKKMFMSGDTLIYNTDAFKVSEEAVLLDLVRKLPGVYFENGQLMYQGKRIQEVRLNGEQFFATNMDIALQNMPVSELEQVKIYDDRSDRDKALGVDTGDRKTVMDMKTKREIKNIKFANLKAGVTIPKHRYQLGGDIAGYSKHLSEFSAQGNMDNLPNGLSSIVNKSAQAYGKRKINDMEVTGDIGYKYSKQKDESASRSESFMDTYNDYSEGESLSTAVKKDLDGSIAVKGKLDKRTRIFFDGLFKRSRERNSSESNTTAYQSGLDDSLWDLAEIGDSYRLNAQKQNSLSTSDSKRARLRLNLSHELDFLHSKLELSVGGDRTQTDKTQFNRSEIRYYQLGDSVYRGNDYVLTPTKNSSFSTKLGWNFPVGKKISLGLNYEWEWNRYENERNLFNIGSLAGMDSYALPQNYLDTRVDSLSSASMDQKNRQTFGLSAFYHGSKLFVSLSAKIYALHRNLTSNRGSYAVDTTTNNIGFNTLLMMNYTTKRNGRVQFSYSGVSRMPSSSDLLPEVNNDNPLYIRIGNPSLKQSYSQQFSVNYQGAVWNATASFRNELNSITRKETYNEQTGGRIVTPENINGNWNADFNGSFRKFWGDFNLSVTGQYGHYNRVGYLSYALANDSEKRTTKSDNVTGDLTMGYQWDWVDLKLTQRATYSHNKDAYRNQETNTKDYSTIMEGNYRLRCGLSFSSDVTLTLRNGYAMEEANHSQLIWNASVKYAFLKGRRASLEFKYFDILKRQKNIFQTVSSFGYNETKYNRLYSYGLLTFVYKFNVMN